MKKIKVFIDWDYTLSPTESHIWTNSSIEEADIAISINKINKLKSNAKKVVWLYEPREICPDAYNVVENRQIPYDLVASHCDTLRSKVNNITINPCFPSWIDKEDRFIYEKTKNASMIASTKIMCSGHVYRQEIAAKIPNSFDIFGHGRAKFLDRKLDGLKEYRFSIAMENSCVNTYYTEKILDCFLTGCIPIYWGTKRILEIFNPKGIIMLKDFLDVMNNFDFISEYESRKEAIIENFEKANLMNMRSEDGINQIVERMR